MSITNWSRKTVLITGGAGLIGSHIAKKLVQKGATIKILENLSAYPFDQITHFGIKPLDNTEIIIGDIKNEEIVRKATNDIDIIFHEAAFADVAATIWNPDEDFKTNVLGTFNLLKEAKERGINRFIFASSAAVYGNQPWNNNGPPKFSEDMKPSPLSTYANSKLWSEYECLLFYNLYGLKTTSLRYFSIYGIPQVPKKGSHSWAVAIFSMRLFKRKPLIIFGDGSQVRDFINVEDVAEATILAAEKNASVGKVINIGTGKATSILRLANLLREMAKINIPIEFRSRPKGDPLGGYADIELMTKTLEWMPGISIEEGLSKYLRWVKDNPSLIPEWI